MGVDCELSCSARDVTDDDADECDIPIVLLRSLREDLRGVICEGFGILGTAPPTLLPVDRSLEYEFELQFALTDLIEAKLGGLLNDATLPGDLNVLVPAPAPAVDAIDAIDDFLRGWSGSGGSLLSRSNIASCEGDSRTLVTACSTGVRGAPKLSVDDVDDESLSLSLSRPVSWSSSPLAWTGSG